MNWFIYNFVLREGALSWLGEDFATLDMSYLGLIFYYRARGGYKTVHIDGAAAENGPPE